MRRSPDKSLGYVLVPLYVELAAGESVEEAVQRAQFDEIWDVLQSIQEQDEVLADLIRHAARQKAKSHLNTSQKPNELNIAFVPLGEKKFGSQKLRTAKRRTCCSFVIVITLSLFVRN